MQGHDDAILAIDTADDIIVSASKDKTVKLWRKKTDDTNNTLDFELLASFSGHMEAVSSLALASKS